MARGKELSRIAKLEFEAGKAKPGPELASLGIDMGGFTKEFNDATRDRSGEIVPAIIKCYSDRTFEFETKTEPAAIRLKKAAKIEKGAANSATQTVAKLTKDQVREIAEYKLVDLNANDIDAAMKIIEGTARNMGIEVEGMTPAKDIEAALAAQKAIAAKEAAFNAAEKAAEEARAAEAAAKDEEDAKEANDTEEGEE